MSECTRECLVGRQNYRTPTVRAVIEIVLVTPPEIIDMNGLAGSALRSPKVPRPLQVN